MTRSLIVFTNVFPSKLHCTTKKSVGTNTKDLGIATGDGEVHLKRDSGQIHQHQPPGVTLQCLHSVPGSPPSPPGDRGRIATGNNPSLAKALLAIFNLGIILKELKRLEGCKVEACLGVIEVGRIWAGLDMG